MESETLNKIGCAVGVVGILIVMVPMAFYGDDYRRSVVFMSISPSGNNTVSSKIILTDYKTDVMTMQLNADLFAHMVCFLAALEGGLLWWKVCGIESEDSVFTESVVLRHGGMCTANHEFWLFVVVHHVVLVMVVVSPVCIHALLLLVFSYVALMFMCCEPANDTCDDSDLDASTEKHVNRVAVFFAYTVITFILIMVDQRLNMATFESIGWGVVALYMQCFFDLVIVLVHTPREVSLLTCYLSRMVYVFACASTVLWWMCC
jgi:hypothetical protein